MEQPNIAPWMDPKNPVWIDRYREAVNRSMRFHEVKEGPPKTFIGRPDTPLDECLRYTKWHTCDTTYRYDRFKNALRLFDWWDPEEATKTSIAEAHVDIGCGAGLFSWAFIDWAIRGGVTFPKLRKLRLYGLDHCEQYLRLSRDIRELVLGSPNMPPVLHHATTPDELCGALKENHVAGTNYTITFGYVLIQAHSPDAIAGFAKVISTVLEVAGKRSTCRLVAVDAESGRRPSQLKYVWKSLLNQLERNNICITITPHSTYGVSQFGAYLRR